MNVAKTKVAIIVSFFLLSLDLGDISFWSRFGILSPSNGLAAGASEDSKAVEPLTAIMEKLRPLHKKLGKPGPGDWLSVHAESGQTFQEYIRSRPVTPRGKTAAQSAITMDISTTVLAATGTTPPANRPLDGENLLPVLRGEKPVHDRTFFWRSKTQIAARKGKWKYIRDPKGEYLCDLSADLGETTNLAAQRPDAVREMKELIRNWEADVKEYQWAPGSRWEKTPGS